MKGVGTQAERRRIERLAVRVDRECTEPPSWCGEELGEYHCYAILRTLATFGSVQKLIIVMAHDHEPANINEPLKLIEPIDVVSILAAADWSSTRYRTEEGGLFDRTDTSWATLDNEKLTNIRDEFVENDSSRFFPIPTVEYKIAVDDSTFRRIEPV